MKTKKMEYINTNIVKQDENELKKVVGGRDQLKRRGYYLGCACPDCGAILEDAKRMRAFIKFCRLPFIYVY